jgi:hypothetical protein
MKRLFIPLFVAVVHLTFAQGRPGIFTTSLNSDNRLSIIKSSINVPVWHEKNFWPLYEDYLSNASTVSISSYTNLSGLAKLDATAIEQEAFEFGNNMIKSRAESLKILEKYYVEIGTAFNGVIALQFLQAESLLDMMECTHIYEETNWKKFKFQVNGLISPQARQVKHNSLRLAISLPAEKAEAFWKVYFRYEEECNALLGENYSIISLYSIEPSDFTPGLSKRLGYDFIKLMQRENRLKEEYFLAMNEAVGASLASRFLAWEDYHSLISKMHAWVEK